MHSPRAVRRFTQSAACPERRALSVVGAQVEHRMAQEESRTMLQSSLRVAAGELDEIKCALRLPALRLRARAARAAAAAAAAGG